MQHAPVERDLLLEEAFFAFAARSHPDRLHQARDKSQLLAERSSRWSTAPGGQALSRRCDETALQMLAGHEA